MIFSPVFDTSSSIPLSEYPRPQMKRNSYFSLNGKWDYYISKSKEISFSENKAEKILVPYSPESVLSGVIRQLKKDEFLFYRKTFFITDEFFKGRILLNVGACDQICSVFVNGIEVGFHCGGYTSFSFDITKAVKINSENEIIFIVQDDADSEIFGRGKQSYKPGGIWYTATSGLWQSVWLESVPLEYIKSIKITPDFDSKKLYVVCNYNSEKTELNVKNAIIRIFDGKKIIAEEKFNREIVVDVASCKNWTLENPELYVVEIFYGEDKIESYFGLRKFSTIQKGKYKYFALNNEPILHNGLLDQGYWHEGFYTPPTNKAMYDEIKSVKEMGFNMLRKHIKVEPLLWYYYCDILGVLVWQDMINGGAKYKQHRIMLCPFVDLKLNDTNLKSMGRSFESCKQFYVESQEIIENLYNCVSLCLWTPFNEAWGQFDSLKVWKTLKEIDNTRPFDHASGWEDMGGGDVCSKHIYFRKIKLKNDKKRVLALTEFGGYSYAMPNHVFAKKIFGYKMYKTQQDLENAIEKLYEKEIIPMIKQEGLSGIVYTELTDVEEELNGLFTYDRVLKVDFYRIKKMNENLYKVFYANL